MEAKNFGAGDCLELFLAEDTIEKFRGNTDEKKSFQYSDTDSKRTALTKEHYI